MKQACLVRCTNDGSKKATTINKSIAYKLARSVPIVWQPPDLGFLDSASSTINRGGKPYINDRE